MRQRSFITTTARTDDLLERPGAGTSVVIGQVLVRQNVHTDSLVHAFHVVMKMYLRLIPAVFIAAITHNLTRNDDNNNSNTRLPTKLRQTTREGVYFRSRDKDGGHTIRSVVAKTSRLYLLQNRS